MGEAKIYGYDTGVINGVSVTILAGLYNQDGIVGPKVAFIYEQGKVLPENKQKAIARMIAGLMEKNILPKHFGDFEGGVSESKEYVVQVTEIDSDPRTATATTEFIRDARLEKIGVLEQLEDLLL